MMKKRILHPLVAMVHGSQKTSKKQHKKMVTTLDRPAQMSYSRFIIKRKRQSAIGNRQPSPSVGGRASGVAKLSQEALAKPPRDMGVPPMKHGQDARATCNMQGVCKNHG